MTSRILELNNINQIEFLKSSLVHNVRLDARSCQEFRKLTFAVHATEQDCHAEVSLGNTSVSVSVQAQLERPFPDRPTDGSVQIKLAPTPLFREDVMDRTHINRMLECILRDSRMIETESLCVLAGKQVWSIVIHVQVLSTDGNVLDCSVFAALAALLAFRRPDFRIDDDGSTVHFYAFAEKTPQPLVLQFLPLSISFAVFENGEKFVMDPNLLEEMGASGSLTICIDAQHKELVALHKKGVSSDLDMVHQTTEMAYRQAAQFLTLLKSGRK